uniref:Nucleoporin NDC1 n=1 Tax=Takifugu rubripes TaxID=31033 RepID=A0A3B5KLD5_TAKRU
MIDCSAQVIYWRAAASIAWAVLLLPPFTAAFVLFSRFSLFHPIQTLSECLAFLTSASAIFSLILLSGVMVILGFLNLEYYTVVPTIACSKIELLGQLLHPRQLANSLICCIMGVIVAWCCAITTGSRYDTLGSMCPQSDGDTSQMCLNEYHLILLLGGAFVGLSHSLLGVIHNMNYVSFNTVQQYKYLCVKGSLTTVVKCSATQALYSVRSFIILHYSLTLTHVYLHHFLIISSVHPLDSIAGLFNLSLVYHLWISASFLLSTWHFTLLLFRIYVTEVYNFPVQSSFTEDVQQCLPKVLSEKQPVILKFMALQDLALLSQHSPSRRCEVFSLSQPGGHPHNWNAISGECLSLLTELNQRLVSYHDSVATNGRAKSLSTASERKTSSETSVTSGAEDPMSPRPTLLLKTPVSVFARTVTGTPKSPLTAPFTPDLDSPFTSPTLRRLTTPAEQCSPWSGTLQSPHVMRRGVKLWSTPTGEGGTNHHYFILYVTLGIKFTLEVKGFLAKRVLIMYLFNKLPEASSQALFADSQAHIWALEGLSCLVQASFSEDQFGVVQTTLPSILSCMLTLQEAVDRHFKLPHASSKPVRSSSSMEDSTHKTLRFALRATLKTAIYRITTTFRDHLKAVQLSPEHQKRLQQFLEYKE